MEPEERTADEEDRRLDALVEVLEALPEDLRNADPRTTDGYQEWLAEELARVMPQHGACPLRADKHDKDGTAS